MSTDTTRVDPAVAEYVQERNERLNTINVLTQQAKNRGNDPTDDELEAIDKCQARIRKLDGIIDILGNNMEMDADMVGKLERMAPGMVPSAPHYRTAGELLWDCVHATAGKSHDRDDQDAKVRYEETLKRAAQHMGTTAAATTPTAGGFGGLFVAPVVGPVINIAPAGQPFLTAIGKQPAPNAMNFTRPRIVDPNFKTGAAVQTLQKAELASVKFDVAVDTLSLATVGGYLNISQQLLSLRPEAFDIILTQMQKRVAWQGEARAITELNLSTAEVNLAAGAAPELVLAALFDAAALVYENTQELPTWIAYGPLGWAMLGKLVDGADRPLFPFLGASNALGTASLGDFGMGPLGLRQIVTPGITTTDIWMGNSLALEAYSYPFPVLEAIEPSVLGRQVAVAEALAFYRPTTAEGDPAEQNGAVVIRPA